MHQCIKQDKAKSRKSSNTPNSALPATALQYSSMKVSSVIKERKQDRYVYVFFTSVVQGELSKMAEQMKTYGEHKDILLQELQRNGQLSNHCR